MSNVARPFAAATVVLSMALAGCARRESPAPETRSVPPTSAATVETPPPSTTTSPATTSEATPTTKSPAPPSAPPAPATSKRAQALLGSSGASATAASPTPSSPPQSAPEPPAAAAAAPPSAAPAPAPAATERNESKVDDPGGIVAVASTNSSAARVGPEKCKVCHKLQFASWSEGGHARRNPPLDCESCHGPGSEYKSLSTMKDRDKARAAGLVLPEAAFCQTCHKRDWKSEMLAKAHAHKAKPAA